MADRIGQQGVVKSLSGSYIKQHPAHPISTTNNELAFGRSYVNIKMTECKDANLTTCHQLLAPKCYCVYSVYCYYN